MVNNVCLCLQVHMFSGVEAFFPEEIAVIEGGTLFIRGPHAGQHIDRECSNAKPPPEDPIPLPPEEDPPATRRPLVVKVGGERTRRPAMLLPRI